MGTSGVVLFEGFRGRQKMNREANLEELLLAAAIISNPGVELNHPTVNLCISISLQPAGFLALQDVHIHTHTEKQKNGGWAFRPARRTKSPQNKRAL